MAQMLKHKAIVAPSSPARGGTRISVTLSADHNGAARCFGVHKQVSMAWMVRDAVDQAFAAHGDPRSRLGPRHKTPKPATGKGAA